MNENDITLIEIGRRAIDREIARRAVQQYEQVGARLALRDARQALANAERSLDDAVVAAMNEQQGQDGRDLWRRATRRNRSHRRGANRS